MAITKKLIHFNQFSNFSTQKLSANRENTSYTVGVGGTVVAGEPYIRYQSIVFIKDVLKIWTHGSLYDCGAVDLSDYLTADEIAEVYATIEALNGKQDKVLKFENMVASNWVADSTYSDFGYHCDMTCTGATAAMFAEVVFSQADAVSGDYAMVCETMTDVVRIYSKKNVSITVPTIIIHK